MWLVTEVSGLLNDANAEVVVAFMEVEEWNLRLWSVVVEEKDTQQLCSYFSSLLNGVRLV